MSKEQQINQITYLKHQNRQAYLVYCQQIITYLTVLNWLKTMYMVKESTIYNEKCTSEAEILSTESHQEIDDVKSLKHKEKPNLKTGLASESLYYQKDNDTGLYYANARYYDSSTARFNREDPIEGNINIPPSLHRYNYAFNNPTVYIDPDGQCVGPITFFVCAAAIGAAINVGIDFAIQTFNKKPNEQYDTDSLIVSGVTGAVSGLVGGALFNSGARAGFALSGAFTADTAIDTAGDFVLDENKDNFDARNRFLINARNNFLAFGFAKVGSELIDILPLNKFLSKPAAKNLENVKNRISRQIKEKSTLRNNANKAFNSNIKLPGFRKAANNLGVALNVRGGKTSAKIRVAFEKDLPSAKALLDRTLKNNSFLLAQSLDGLIGASLGPVIDKFADNINITLKNGVLTIEIPNSSVISPKIYKFYLKSVGDELGIDLPEVDFSSLVDKNGVLPNDFELTQTFERKVTEEKIVKENPDKPGVKGE